MTDSPGGPSPTKHPFDAPAAFAAVASEHSHEAREPFAWLIDDLRAALSDWAKEGVRFVPSNYGCEVLIDGVHKNDYGREAWFYAKRGLWLLWFYAMSRITMGAPIPEDLIAVELGPVGRETWTVNLSSDAHRAGLEECLNCGVDEAAERLSPLGLPAQINARL